MRLSAKKRVLRDVDAALRFGIANFHARWLRYLAKRRHDQRTDRPKFFSGQVTIEIEDYKYRNKKRQPMWSYKTTAEYVEIFCSMNRLKHQYHQQEKPYHGNEGKEGHRK